MKVRNIVICLAVILFSVPLIHGQDLSKYRQFSLGASLAAVSKQIDQNPGNAALIEQSPATIQQLEWWPVSVNVFTRPEAVQRVTLSFYNGKLYKIATTYDNDATAGLTGGDMIAAISANYGSVNKVDAEIDTHAELAYGTVEPIAQWEDTQYSVTLSWESVLKVFRLVVLTKQVNAEAEASVIEAAKQEQAYAPQKEVARGKEAADKLETERQANLKTFRP